MRRRRVTDTVSLTSETGSSDRLKVGQRVLEEIELHRAGPVGIVADLVVPTRERLVC